VDPSPPPAVVQQEPPYVYAATDIRPRQQKEIELCEKASHFDWQYTGAMGLLFATSVYFNLDYFKQHGPVSIRMIGPMTEGFFWGGFLSGGYLSLPKCDPLWAPGAPPEGNVRAAWPIATAITLLSAISAPFLDYTFLGFQKPGWSTEEKSARIFIAGGFGVMGALFPYLLPPRTWAAAKQIEKMRVEGYRDGAVLSYRVLF
jgi:hypothetical protein